MISIESSTFSPIKAWEEVDLVVSQGTVTPVESSNTIIKSDLKRIVGNIYEGSPRNKISPTNITSPTNKQPKNKHRMLRFSGAFNQGFESPKSKNLDQATKDLIKGLQSRVVRLEKEMLKLKKENLELLEDNKRCQEIASLTVIEQEKAAKVKIITKMETLMILDERGI